MLGRALATATILAAASASWAATGVSSTQTPARIVPCGESINEVTFPYRAGAYRLVLGELSVPPKFMKQVVRSTRARWPYWRKAGLVVRAGAPSVTVSVPRKWRSRVAITWGNGSAPVSSVRIARCGGSKETGHAYAGGFYLRSRAACVPLTFLLGARTATVHFGVGQRC